jgi:hypothetical protein
LGNQNQHFSLKSGQKSHRNATEPRKIRIKIYQSATEPREIGIEIYQSATEPKEIGIEIYQSATEPKGIGIEIYQSATEPGMKKSRTYAIQVCAATRNAFFFADASRTTAFGRKQKKNIRRMCYIFRKSVFLVVFTKDF